VDPFDALDYERRQQARHIISVVLDHSPGVAATHDGRYFLFPRGIQSYLAELVEQCERPVHYRKVAERFNESVKAGSRKGAGYILDMLSHTPACQRVDRGVNDLRSAPSPAGPFIRPLARPRVCACHHR
jgi:hypothetical protein